MFSAFDVCVKPCISLNGQTAYKIVQTNAMKIWAGEAKSFLELLKSDKEIVGKLGVKKLEEIFDIKYHTKNIDHIFKQVFFKN